MAFEGVARIGPVSTSSNLTGGNGGLRAPKAWAAKLTAHQMREVRVRKADGESFR